MNTRNFAAMIRNKPDSATSPYRKRPLWKRAIIWSLHRPRYALLSTWWIVAWAVVTGCKPIDWGVEDAPRETRLSTVMHFWDSGRSLAAIRMGDTISLKEWLKDM